MVRMKAPEVVSLTIRLPRPYYDRLARLAASEISSLNREVNIAVRAHLDANRSRLKGAKP